MAASQPRHRRVHTHTHTHMQKDRTAATGLLPAGPGWPLDYACGLRHSMYRPAKGYITLGAYCFEPGQGCSARASVLFSRCRCRRAQMPDRPCMESWTGSAISY